MSEKQYWDPNICPLCGNDEFAWGILLGYRRAFFRPDGVLPGGGKPLEGRQCLRCGNVQIFAEVAQSPVRKRKFE